MQLPVGLWSTILSWSQSDIWPDIEEIGEPRRHESRPQNPESDARSDGAVLIVAVQAERRTCAPERSAQPSSIREGQIVHTAGSRAVFCAPPAGGRGMRRGEPTDAPRDVNTHF